MKEVRLYFIILFLLSCAVQTRADNGWQLMGGKVSFSIKNAGFTVDGTLDSLSVMIDFDTASTTNAVIKASVQSSTINTNNSLRDSHLKKQDYLFVEKYSSIMINSVSIQQVDKYNYKGKFNLILKGIKKEILIPFQFIQRGNEAKVEGSFTINRRDFGVGGKSFILSDNVDVKIIINLRKKIG